MRPESAAPGGPWPVQTLSYGTHPEQFGQLRTPPAGSAAVPVVVLVHGGYWRSKWRLDLMEPLAADLARRGIASWNIEYRRPDRHGWDATTADVEAAVRHLDRLAEAQRRGLSNGAVAAALGRSAAELPDVYAAASPLQRLPLGIPQVIVTAQDDSAVPNDLSERYVAAARAAGDPVTVVHGDGDHFTLIDPASRLWADTCQQMLAALDNS